MIKNLHGVPRKLWNRWGDTAKLVFQKTLEVVKDNPDLILHPKTVKMSDPHWQTVAWNVAVIAADAVKAAQ